MSHVSLTELRKNLANYFDQVSADREPLFVTRLGGKGTVVVIAEEEFAGWQDTVHLLSSPRNAERLMASVQQARNGETVEHDLISPAKPA